MYQLQVNTGNGWHLLRTAPVSDKNLQELHQQLVQWRQNYYAFANAQFRIVNTKGKMK